MSEFEPHHGGAATAERESAGVEYDVGIESEDGGLDAIEPLSAETLEQPELSEGSLLPPNLFELKDGKWMTNIETADGETLEIELLAHDPELQEKVLGLEIGSEPIINEAEGVNENGEPVTFTSTYERTGEGIVMTAGEALREVLPEPQPEDDGDADDMTELPSAIAPTATPDPIQPPAQPVTHPQTPAATAPNPGEPTPSESAFSAETPVPEPPKAEVTSLQSWWQQEIGLEAKTEAPSSLFTFLERAAQNDEAVEPSQETRAPEKADSAEPAAIEVSTADDDAEEVAETPVNTDAQDQSTEDQPLVAETPSFIEAITTETATPQIAEPTTEAIHAIDEQDTADPTPDPEPGGGQTVTPEQTLVQAPIEVIKHDEQTGSDPVEEVASVTAEQTAPPVVVKQAQPQHPIQTQAQIQSAPKPAEQPAEKPAEAPVEKTIEAPSIAENPIAAPTPVERPQQTIRVEAPTRAAAVTEAPRPAIKAGETVNLRIETPAVTHTAIEKPQIAKTEPQIQAQTVTVETPAPVIETPVETPTEVTFDAPEPATIQRVETVVAPKVEAAPPVRASQVEQPAFIPDKISVVEERVIEEAPAQVLPPQPARHTATPAPVMAAPSDITQEIHDDGIQITAELHDIADRPRQTTRRHTAHMTVAPQAVAPSRPTPTRETPTFTQTLRPERPVIEPITVEPPKPVAETPASAQTTHPENYVKQAPVVEKVTIESKPPVHEPINLKPAAAEHVTPAPTVEVTRSKRIDDTPEVRTVPQISDELPRQRVEAPTAIEPAMLETTRHEAANPKTKPHSEVFTPEPQLEEGATFEPTTVQKNEKNYQKSATVEPPKVPAHKAPTHTEPTHKAPEVAETPFQSWANDFGSRPPLPPRPSISRFETLAQPSATPSTAATQTNNDPDITIDFNTEGQRHVSRRHTNAGSTTA